MYIMDSSSLFSYIPTAIKVLLVALATACVVLAALVSIRPRSCACGFCSAGSREKEKNSGRKVPLKLDSPLPEAGTGRRKQRT